MEENIIQEETNENVEIYGNRKLKVVFVRIFN